MSTGILQPTELAPSVAHLELPFSDDVHRCMGAELSAWANAQSVDERDDRPTVRDWVRRLGSDGWLRYCVPGDAGGALPGLDSRALAILREALAVCSPLADFAFAMRGLGSSAISIAGSSVQRAACLPAVARGEKIAAFALSEPEAGSDVAAMRLQATASGGGFEPNGRNTWISNGGPTGFYRDIRSLRIYEGATEVQ